MSALPANIEGPPIPTAGFGGLDITFKLGGTTYEWRGGYGAVIVSYERGLKAGDVRCIKGIIFTVFKVDKRGFFNLGKPEVCWTLPGNFNAEWIAAFRCEILC